LTERKKFLLLSLTLMLMNYADETTLQPRNVLNFFYYQQLEIYSNYFRRIEL
jgi:hypothetical protein